jgi:hypothetical protein
MLKQALGGARPTSMADIVTALSPATVAEALQKLSPPSHDGEQAAGKSPIDNGAPSSVSGVPASAAGAPESAAGVPASAAGAPSSAAGVPAPLAAGAPAPAAGASAPLAAAPPPPSPDQVAVNAILAMGDVATRAALFAEALLGGPDERGGLSASQWLDEIVKAAEAGHLTGVYGLELDVVGVLTDAQFAALCHCLSGVDACTGRLLLRNIGGGVK